MAGTDVTQYADKPATDVQKWFAQWAVREVGFDIPENPRAAFLAGIRLAFSARRAFNESDFLADKYDANPEIVKRGRKPAEEVEDEPVVTARTKRSSVTTGRGAGKTRRIAEPEEEEIIEEIETDEDDFEDDVEVDDDFDDDADDSDDDFDDDDTVEDDDFEEEEEPPRRKAAIKRAPARKAATKAAPRKAAQPARKATASRQAPTKRAAAPAARKTAPTKRTAAKRTRGADDDTIF
jgi:hypothetical protein